MKKFIYSIMFLAGAAMMSSCGHELLGPKDEVGGTATQLMAGEWMVHVDGVDANGNVVMEDPFGYGSFELLTYNTSANVENKMFVDDEGNFWEMKGEVDCNLENLTFSATGVKELYNDITFDVLNGKILPGAAHSELFGHVADSICFDVKFSNDDYIGELWDAIRFSGYRRTGFDQGAE